MVASQDTVIRISPGTPEIVVEQNVNGVMTRKNITPEALADCLLGSRFDDSMFDSGQ